MTLSMSSEIQLAQLALPRRALLKKDLLHKCPDKLPNSTQVPFNHHRLRIVLGISGPLGSKSVDRLESGFANADNHLYRLH